MRRNRAAFSTYGRAFARWPSPLRGQDSLASLVWPAPAVAQDSGHAEREDLAAKAVQLAKQTLNPV